VPRLPQEVVALALVFAGLSHAARAPAPAGPGEACESCHDAWAAKKVVHPPVKSGLCFACHVSTSESQHSFGLTGEGKAMCLQCHSARNGLKVLHPPVSEGLCLNCHDPHGSDHLARLRQGVFETCTACHPSKRMQNEAAETKHGALDPKENPKVCVACHDPHQSNFEKRLVAWPPMNVCFQCHDKQLETPTGSIIALKGWVEQHPDAGMRHGPVREGRCPDCHEPHGTSEWRMLKGSFPGTPYAPFAGAETYGLCFRCHDQRLVLEQRFGDVAPSQEDPSKDLAWGTSDAGTRLLRAGVTGFRNGDENLHFRHVNKYDKGRPCRLCHDVHASENAKHIRTSTPFGTWEFKLNYQKTKTGGSCWPGCHVQRRYDRETKQENPR
jgi:predicted CXXCH cytochrome family protein